MAVFENPIIPGFYPDPSICRVGDDYYLVNSSFEFFPGVPLWHSKDLVNWEQLGYVLTRESQLNLKGCRTSGGIYAPTIRYHNGRFYMITTNVSCGGNFIVWTDDIRGEWSDPIFVDQEGIDPSLFWDDDGKVYYTGTHHDEAGKQCIGQFEIDLETGNRLSETKGIWYGNGGKYPEGPHMYKINGWYYLLIAEGGTEYGHMVTVARSRNVWGPFESCPHNPILTHCNAKGAASEFQATGHSDIFTDTDGKWWIVFHAIRPSMFMLHHVGRETMLAPLTWDENGWPVVNNGEPVSAVMEIDREEDHFTVKHYSDDFASSVLHPRWSWLRNPDYTKYTYGSGYLELTGGKDDLDIPGASPSFLGVRQQQFDQIYETVLVPESGTGKAGITVFHTNEHHYDLFVRRTGNDCTVQLYRRVADMNTISEPVVFENADSLVLRIAADRQMYHFYAGTDSKNMVLIGTGSTQLLSTEIMNCTFTGCFVGLFAVGDISARFNGFCVTEPAK